MGEKDNRDIYPVPKEYNPKAEPIKSIEKNYAGLWWCGFTSLVIIGGIFLYLSNQHLLPSQAPAETSQTEQISAVDTSGDPIQTGVDYPEDIEINTSAGQAILTPEAKYEVSAEVMSSKNYDDDWSSEFETTDLALAWGKLAEPEYQEGIEYWQSNRWYYYQYDRDFQLDNQYIINHSSNHHLIPADENIKKAARRITPGDKVHIWGYLVNVKYFITSGSGYTQQTSLTRSDTAGGSCEIMYVTKLQVNDKVYE